MKTLASRSCWILCLILAAACGGDGGSTAPNADGVSSVTVAPSTLALQVGQSQDFVATPVNASGAAVSGRTVTWTVSDQQRGNITTAGRFTAATAGTVTVSATVDGKVGQATVTITSAPVATTVTVTPSTVSLTPGATQQLSASVLDQNSNVMNGQGITWSTSASAVATVSSTGLVTAVAAGTASITATLTSNPQRSATATVSVASGTIVLTSGVGVAVPATTVGQQRAYRIDVPASATQLTVLTAGGSGDADLYVRFGQAPTTTTFGCSSTGATSAESCVVANPTSGSWFILVDAFTAFSGVTLTATVATGSGGGGAATYRATFTVPTYRVNVTSESTGAVCPFDITWTSGTATITANSVTAGTTATFRVVGSTDSRGVIPIATGPGGSSNCNTTLGNARDTSGSVTLSIPNQVAVATRTIAAPGAGTETYTFNGVFNGDRSTISGTLTFAFGGQRSGSATINITLVRQ